MQQPCDILGSVNSLCRLLGPQASNLRTGLSGSGSQMCTEERQNQWSLSSYLQRVGPGGSWGWEIPGTWSSLNSLGARGSQRGMDEEMVLEFSHLP